MYWNICISHLFHIWNHVIFDKLIDKIEQSQHDCIIHNNRLYCSKCQACIHVRAAHIEDFIKSSCLPTQHNYCFAVGHQHTHHSHRMVIYGGIYMCTKCGSTGSRKLMQLSRECKPPKTRGQQNIDAYAAGTSPAGYNNWPYKRVHLDENIAVNNVQTLVDRMHNNIKMSIINKTHMSMMPTMILHLTRTLKRWPNMSLKHVYRDPNLNLTSIYPIPVSCRGVRAVELPSYAQSYLTSSNENLLLIHTRAL